MSRRFVQSNVSVWSEWLDTAMAGLVQSDTLPRQMYYREPAGREPAGTASPDFRIPGEQS